MNIHITWLTHVRTGPKKKKKKIATGHGQTQPKLRRNCAFDFVWSRCQNELRTAKP